MTTFRSRLRLPPLAGLLLGLALGAGCKQSQVAEADLSGGVGDGGVDLASAGDGASSCPRLARGEDATRAIVVSHPFSEPNGDKAMDYELLSLDSSGAITRPGTHFQMGYASTGQIAFTPDGAVGFVAQEHGGIGVFRLDQGQPPVVVAADHMTGYYAGRLLVSPAGDQLYFLNDQTENNGGGIYVMPIHCDGSLGEARLISAADLPYAMVLLPGGQAGLYARALAGAATDESAHLVKLGPPFSRLASAVSFPLAGSDSIIASSALTQDGRYLLFGDNSMFSSQPNRIAAVELKTGMLRAAQVLAPITDPVSMVTSPYNNAVLVSSSFDDALVVLGYDPTSASTPFSNRGALTPVGAKPELPGSAILIDRGALKGRVYVAENLGIRQVRFETDGKVTDLGKFSMGTGLASIVGAIGIQP